MILGLPRTGLPLGHVGPTHSRSRLCGGIVLDLVGFSHRLTLGEPDIEWIRTDLGPEVAAMMRRWPADDPIRKLREKPYGLAEWGLAVEDLDPLQADCTSRYGTEMEALAANSGTSPPR